MLRPRGFTLIELTAVIAIAGALAVIVLPRFFDTSGFERRGFYDQVISSLRYAQKAAIAQRRFVCVAFGANSVTLTYDSIPPSITHIAATCPGTTLSGLNGQSSYNVSSSSASFSSLPADFSFDAMGSPSFASKKTINISSVTNPIYVEAETGYVH